MKASMGRSCYDKFKSCSMTQFDIPRIPNYDGYDSNSIYPSSVGLVDRYLQPIPRPSHWARIWLNEILGKTLSSQRLSHLRSRLCTPALTKLQRRVSSPDGTQDIVTDGSLTWSFASVVEICTEMVTKLGGLGPVLHLSSPEASSECTSATSTWEPKCQSSRSWGKFSCLWCEVLTFTFL